MHTCVYIYKREVEKNIKRTNKQMIPQRKSQTAAKSKINKLAINE